MATYGEIAWEDDSGSNGGGQKQNTKDSWLRLEGGSNVVRLVTLPHQYIVHKGVKAVGDKGYGQKVNCSNPDGKGSCPLCDKGLKAGQRWFLGVIDKTNTYKILDISHQVYSQIKNLARSTVWGDPMKYDIDIVVNKNGGPTGYYSVQPIPHKPLSLDAQKAKDGADLDVLKLKVTPPSLEFVQKRLEKLLEGEALFIPPKPVVAKGAASGKGKASAEPQVNLENDDSVDDIFPDHDAPSV